MPPGKKNRRWTYNSQPPACVEDYVCKVNLRYPASSGEAASSSVSIIS